MPKLLDKDPTRIGRPGGSRGEADRFPDSLSKGTPKDLADGLVALLGSDVVHTRPMDLVRFASDAAPYRLFPQVVVSPRDVSDVVKIFEYGRAHGRHITFRSGGSSVSGQTQGDDIIVDVRTHFRGMVVEGDRLRVQPGEVLAGVQNVLAHHGRRFGPDPASAAVATIGGILSNNSGGMRCTVAQDSYHSILDATIVLPSGYVLNTADPSADDKLAAAEPALVQGLMAIRDEIIADEDLVDRLRRKYTIRNTNSIRLDAFLDGPTPVQILKRLMIGAEGTLGFIGESVLDTLPLPTMRAVVWVMLPDVVQAAGFVHQIVQAGADACELLVAPVLRESVGNFKGTFESWSNLPHEAAALLVEVPGLDEEDLQRRIAAVKDVLKDAPLTEPLTFMREKAAMDQAWQIRKGLLPLIGKQRPQGAALITEDACVPPDRIGEAAADLMSLLRSKGLPEFVAGHAAFGNLHFFLTPNFDDEEETKNYAEFIDAFVALIVDKYDGSLKAEHGTGIAMAPFVEREWGARAFALMWRTKHLLDPEGMLAPNIKLTHDQQLHLKNFKSVPEIEDVATDCIECGFCESVCPSRNVTVTPRQRIVLRREMARQPEGSAFLRSLQEDYGYDAIEMCAADGTCSVPCPVSIDTGKLMKKFRRMEATDTADRVALTLAKHWDKVEVAARGGLGAAGVVTRVLGDSLGTKVLGSMTDTVRRVVSEDLVPTAREGLPPRNRAKLPETKRENAAAVYFPACINRIFGRANNGPSLPETLVALSERAGKPVVIPEDIGGCCATPFSSKGYSDATEYLSVRMAEDLWRWSEHGRLPVVIDAASCTHRVVDEIRGQLTGKTLERFNQITVMDAVTWANRELLPNLEVAVKVGRVAVHPNCSMIHMDMVGELMTVASFAADSAFVPTGATCCGTAGDRGLLHPELVESATRDEREGLAAAERQGPIDRFVSANRTCEMGLSQATGRDYEHVLFMLDEATRAK